MRRAVKAAPGGAGGACEFMVRRICDEESKFKMRNASAVGNTAATSCAWEAVSTQWVCKNGACKDDMVWQQSWLPSSLCSGQGMLSQHCIASSGVEAAKQSNA
jgi:hypothetical protein